MIMMKKIYLPLATHHNVRGPLSKIFTEGFELVNILPDEMVDMSRTKWAHEIEKQFEALKQNEQTGEINIVAIGNSLVNVIAVNEALKHFEIVNLIVYDSSSRQYRVWSLPNKEVKF